MHFQRWSFCHQSQKYGHVPSTRHHLVSCGQMSAFTSGIKQCIVRRYLFVSFRRTYYGHILSRLARHQIQNYFLKKQKNQVTLWWGAFLMNLSYILFMFIFLYQNILSDTNVSYIEPLHNNKPYCSSWLEIIHEFVLLVLNKGAMYFFP